MAISPRTQGTWQTAALNDTATTFTIPAHQAGDLLLMRFFCKPFGASPSIDQGWTIFGNGAGGSTANGNGLGSVYGGFAYKIATSASETDPILTWGTSANPGFAVIDSWQKGAGEAFIAPVGVFKGFTAVTSVSVTMNSNPGVTAGDMCVAGFGVGDNITTTVPTFTQTGVTFAAVTEWPATALSTATGNDASGDGCYRLASSGTGSAAPVLTMTNSAAEEGVVIFARLRVTAMTTETGSATLDATLLKTQTGSPTLDAILFGTQSGSLSLDSVLRKMQQAAVSADAIILVSQSSTFSLDAVLEGGASGAVWTTPADLEEVEDLTPTLAFNSLVSVRDMHFEMQLDTVDTFDSGDLLTFRSFPNAAGWQYWDGSSWEPVANTGLDPADTGSEVRFTIPTPLVAGVWFRRVRASV